MKEELKLSLPCGPCHIEHRDSYASLAQTPSHLVPVNRPHARERKARSLGLIIRGDFDKNHPILESR